MRRTLVAVGSVVLCSACTTPRTPTIAIEPGCAIHANVNLTGPGRIAVNGSPFTAFRTGADTDFSAFIATGGPIGDPSTGLPDTFALREAWQHQPIGAKVYRGQVVPATRILNNNRDFNNRRWVVDVQDAKLGWKGPVKSTSLVLDNTSPLRSDGFGSDPADEQMMPQFMAVGQAVPEMFFCAGERTADDANPTTWLFQSTPPDANGTGGNRFVQDILNGDNILRQNATVAGAPLPGTMGRPRPSIGAPGAPISTGHVSCAMTQSADNIATRVLHVLAVHDGKLLHSVLTDFGAVTDGDTPPFSTVNRFRAVTPWAEVQPQWGVDIGHVGNFSAVVKGQALHVFIVARTTSALRLWHTVRFNSGQWTAPRDVWRESGDAFNGSAYPFRVSAGVCPSPGASVWNDANTETVLALLGGPSGGELLSMRVVSQPQLWVNGRFPSVYSPWRTLAPGAMTQIPPASFFVRSVSVTARPFRASAMPQ